MIKVLKIRRRFQSVSLLFNTFKIWLSGFLGALGAGFGARFLADFHGSLDVLLVDDLKHLLFGSVGGVVGVEDIVAESLDLLVEFLDLSGLVADGQKQGVELLVVDILGILLFYTHQIVCEHVHVVCERRKRAVVGAERRMACTVGHVLGAHIVEVVAALQILPVLLQTAVLAEVDALGHCVELAESLVLELVTFPGGDVASLVNVGDRERNRDHVDRFELGDHVAGSRETYAFLLAETRKGLHEVEDASAGGEERSECLHTHVEIDNLLVLGEGSKPVNIFVGREWIFVPGGVVEVA